MSQENVTSAALVDARNEGGVEAIHRLYAEDVHTAGRVSS